ncbi:hypothetical protein I545_4691 [Mycobacterium kansasii 662]|uniref:Pentapeptide repeats family protein n=2 Tax=Mycobacterium kansasii TaxID=1768 RepID=A0A7G1IPW3_MYCKA|nr:hypothetical protein I545_4691 [Mycobacterium kansasii 662]BCI92374.1 hypothetical protein NIIDMKKI_75800 [Mycobacterium kansasii]
MNTGLGATTDTGLTNSGFSNIGVGMSGFFNTAAGGTTNHNISGVFNTATGAITNGNSSGFGNTGVPGIIFGPALSGGNSGLFNNGTFKSGFFNLTGLFA